MAGIRWAVTTLEVTTGSVGVSTAASRKASLKESAGKIPQAIRPSRPRVIGIATTIARVTGPQ